MSELPGSNTNRLLYSSEIRSGSMSAIVDDSFFKIFSKSSTFFCDNRLILVCQDVDPVPVDTQSPELFVFVIFWVVLGRMCRWLTRADSVSPIKTCKQYLRLIQDSNETTSLL